MNGWDLVIVALIVGVVVLARRSRRRDVRRGCSGCCASCSQQGVPSCCEQKEHRS